MGVIFISHSSKNNAEAVAVRDWLRGEGYGETFLDLDPEHGLAPGQRWEEELQKAGERCLAVVVLVSPDWCASKWCFHEFKFAKALGKKIFPVLVQPTPWGELPLELTSQFQMANISSPELREDGLTRLRFGLQRAGLDPKHFRLAEGRPPYRGLKALEEEDAAIFFGRDAQITAGLDALRQMRGGSPQRILTIAAASGAGKSSFLKAGLLARLKRDEENFFVLPTWRPGRDALSGETGLANAFGGTAPQAATDALAARQAAVVARFQSMASAANEPWRGTPPTLVLPLDQAEELFSADNARAPGAIQLLLEVLASKPDLIVAATIRSDALGSLQADSRLAALLRLFNLPALPPSAFREVIEGPARLTDPPITINPALTDRLIADLDKADALPLLAFTLERLVTDYGRDRTLSLQEYETGLGGVSGAINAAVEAALRKAEADPALPSIRHELDSLARAAFIPWLVQLDEADASPKRRVSRLSDIPEASRPLIGHFIEERLLVASESAGETVVEVSHEAVLRHWRGLAAWISEERIMLERLQRVQRASQEWSADIRALNRADMLVHRGERLKLAEELLKRADLAPLLTASGATYLKECRTVEDEATARDRAQAERELRQRRRAGRWQAMAALVLVLGFGALAFAGLFLVNERRAYGKAQSLMLARTAGQFEAAGDHQRALALSILASRENVLAPSTPEAWAAYASSAQSVQQTLALAHESYVWGAVFSNDETRILTWSEDGTGRLWDVETGEQVGPAFEHEDPVKGAAFSKDETRVLTWSYKEAQVWDAASGAPIGPALSDPDYLGDVAFVKDDARVVVLSGDKKGLLWNPETGLVDRAPFQHESRVYGSESSKDKSRIFVWSEDGNARLWDMVTGAQIGPVLQHDSNLSGVAFSEDNTRILVMSADKTARLRDAASGAQIGSVIRHYSNLSGADFSTDGTRILTWSEDSTARLWDVATGAQVGPTFEHEGPVSGADFFEDENRILTWSEDRTARLWDLATGAQVGSALRHEGPVKGVAFSGDETRVLTWGDNIAQLWDTTSGAPIGPALRHDSYISGAAFSKDETRILTWSEDGTVRLWALQSDGQVQLALKHEGSVGGAVFSKDETRVLTRSANTARLWNAATGAPIGAVLQHDINVSGADFSQDETRILTWTEDGTARLWDAETGEQVGAPFEYEGSDSSAAISKDKSRVVTWSANTVQLSDAATGKPAGRPIRHKEYVRGAAFSEVDGRILTWSDDGTAQVWNAVSGLRIGPAFQQGGQVLGAAFSKDETRILTWGTETTARLWDATSGAQLGPGFRHQGSIFGAAFSEDETRILTWSIDSTARLWDAETGVQIGPAFKHEDFVTGAIFSNDETRILTWGADNTARLWEVRRAMINRPDETHIADICEANLRGALAPDNRGQLTPFPRLIDAKIVEAAPILRGREGEDVCSPPAKPFWEHPLQAMLAFVAPD